MSEEQDSIIKQLLVFNQDPDFRNRIREMDIHLGLMKIFEFKDYKSVEAACDIKDFNLVIFHTKNKEVPEDCKKVIELCLERNIPLIVIADKKLSVGTLPANSVHLPLDVSDQNFFLTIDQLLHAVPLGAETLGRIKEILLKLHFFQGLSNVTLESLIHKGVLKDFAPNQTVFKKGGYGNHFCIIIQGKLRVYFEKKEVAKLGAGDCFGEMSLVSPEEPRRVAISTISPVKLFVLPKGFLDKLSSEEQVEIYRVITMVLAEKLKKTTMLLNQQ